ncbi:imidazole glycerol phosphate synthase subunit HisF (plasmid) [Azospirillum sp. TSA2s]|nr:AglZ/HisF2 family acetamidino modification protein [Azospirillum sp. TSA2s]QCG93212.1 imidazole glycerol phosphate synthase subunit HisF [Azospirillum sp. TSA2s]
MSSAIRMIPCLLLKEQSFYKTTRFGEPRYLGDPINIVRIFNEKEVDELCILDIGATPEDGGPQFDYLAELAEECFMPLSYGGGISSVEDCRRLISSGFEKVILNTAAAETPELIGAVSSTFGSQAVVVSLDVRRSEDSQCTVWTRGGTCDTGEDPVTAARRAEALGAGEILLNAIDRDGTMAGYDLGLIQAVASAVQVPVIACGGARDIEDLVAASLDAGASAVAAGSLFVFFGRRRAVLINPPTYDEFQQAVAAGRVGRGV